MTDRDESLDALHARYAAAGGSDAGSWATHAAILDRLEENRRAAEAAGWTSLAIERDGNADRGRFRLMGVPPNGALREEVPDR